MANAMARSSVAEIIAATQWHCFQLPAESGSIDLSAGFPLIECVVGEAKAADAVVDRVINDGSQGDGVANYSGWKQAYGPCERLG